MNTQSAQSRRTRQLAAIAKTFFAGVAVAATLAAAGEPIPNPTAPTLPGETKPVDVKPEKGSRPRSKYWLDDPVTKPKDIDGRLPEPFDPNVLTAGGYPGPTDTL